MMCNGRENINKLLTIRKNYVILNKTDEVGLRKEKERGFLYLKIISSLLKTIMKRGIIMDLFISIFGDLATYIIFSISLVVSWLGKHIARHLKGKFIMWFQRRNSNTLPYQGLANQWKNIEKASGDICREINRSQKTYILTGLGTKIEDIFNEINGSSEIIIFLPDTEPESKINWLDKRGKEIAKYSALGQYKDYEYVKNEIELIYRTAAYKVEEWRDSSLYKYNFPHNFRIILTDNYAYFSPYVKNKFIDTTPICCYVKGSYMFEHLKKVIDNTYELIKGENNI